MSFTTGEGIPPQTRVEELYGPLMGAMEQLDESAQVYFATCSDYARWPSNANLDGIAGSTEAHMLASERFLSALGVDTDLEEYRTAATKFLVGQDNLRVSTLNTLLGTDRLEKLESDEELQRLLDELEDEDASKEAIADIVLEAHKLGHVGDTGEFIAGVRGSDAARRMERQNKLKEQAVEVGKYALGAAFGTIVGVMLTRRRG